MTDNHIKVRIAPSPTGYLHVGTARTAIFNYLFARHYGGEFVVRIEDTDLERSKPELIEPIVSALKWLGLAWDEKIVYQSQRSELYREAAQRLVDTGHAYRSFATPEEIQSEREKSRAEKRPFNRDLLRHSEEETARRLDAGEPYSVRLRIPDGVTTFSDMVLGEISRDYEDIEDLVIARSDGSATYNLAVVVDDHDMGITHVIRGNDHISNTFKQIHIYRALGYDVPQFGHVPLILRPDKKKVSKRLGDKDVAEYRAEGILPEAMFNYLCLLGWSPKTDREVYTPEELIGIFDEKHFNPSNAVFDEEKLLAINREHIMKKTDHDLAVLVAPLFVDAGLTTKYWLETRWVYLREVIRLLKERAKRLTDFVSMGGYFFSFDYTYDPKAEQKRFTPVAANLLEELAARFEALEPFTHETAEQALVKLAEEKNVKPAELIHPTRLAVSGVPAGPGLYDMLAVLSQRVVVERMRKAVEHIRNTKHSSE
jgi:glutamyl-tRNA synthetase